MNLILLYLIITIFIRNPQRNNKSFFEVRLPKVLRHPPIVIIPDKVENNTLKKGDDLIVASEN